MTNTLTLVGLIGVMLAVVWLAAAFSIDSLTSEDDEDEHATAVRPAAPGLPHQRPKR